MIFDKRTSRPDWTDIVESVYSTGDLDQSTFDVKCRILSFIEID